VAEPADDLVEDQQRALAVADRAQALEETRLGQDARRVVADRLDDQGRDLAARRGERSLDVLEVVVPADQRGVDGRLEHARRARIAAPDALGCRQHVAKH
jgi:hypothetical protein